MNRKNRPADVDVLEHETVYQGYFRIDAYTLRHTRFDGGWTEPFSREVFERGHAAGLLAYDPDRREFVMCEQFRVGAYTSGMSPWLLEIVAGIIEEGEHAEDVARREALEEIGLHVTDVLPIQRYLVSPGGTSETSTLYLGRVSSENAGGIFGLDENGEHIRVKVIAEDELRGLMTGGKLTNAMTLIAAQWFFLNRDKVREAWRAST
ncbi:MAG: NUDIX domain-containing protein [Rhodospirillaceae bacterium]